MSENVMILVAILFVVNCLISFALGFLYCSTKAENKFLRVSTKFMQDQEKKLNEIKKRQDNAKITFLDEKEMPRDFLEFLERIASEQDESSDEEK